MIALSHMNTLENTGRKIITKQREVQEKEDKNHHYLGFDVSK